MKLKLTLLVLLIWSAQAYSQSKNTISFAYGITANDVNIHGAIGDFGYEGKGGSQFGLYYIRSINKVFSLRSGVQFSSDDVQFSSILPGASVVRDGNIKLVTIPIVARISFLKLLYVEGGVIADFETNYSGNGTDQANKTATRQNGIGLELGAGAKYDIGHWNVFVSPFLQNHAMGKFNTSGSNFNLFDTGFRFGAGYSF